MTALFKSEDMLDSFINGCETATAITLQSTKPQQHHNIRSGADFAFSSHYSVSPQRAVPESLSTTEGLIKDAIPG